MDTPQSKTISQKTSLDGWPKARELVEFTGHHTLETNDRTLLNALYQIAHDSGKMTEKDAEWTVPLSGLRPSKHESSDRLRKSLDRLLSVVVTVPYIDPRTSEERYLKTHLFDFFDVSANEGTAAATLRFGLPKELQPILARSGKWGRIRAEVVLAMTSKYAIALYELVQTRANLDRCVETIPLERFRQLMGVPPGKLKQGNDFRRSVLDPAVLEVNGLSDVGVTLEIVRKSPKRPQSPIVAISMAWWHKQGDEYRASVQERARPKVGRMARLKGTVEAVEPTPKALPAAPAQFDLDETVRAVQWVAKQAAVGLEEDLHADYAEPGEPLTSTRWKLAAWRELGQPLDR